MALEKTINAEGFFGKIQQALREGLGRELSGGANLGTVTLEVKDARMERAEAGIGRAEELNRAYGQRPGGGMAGNWDRPEDYPERDLGPMGSSRWQSLLQGGGIHTLRNVGSFYQRWGSTLGESDRSDASMWSAISASPQGRRVEESFSGIERAGKKMADLMTEYEQAGQGTPAAMRATEQMVKLHEAIQALAKSGGEAADAIGGDHGGKLRRELDDVSKLAMEGKLPGSAGGGGGLTGGIGDFMRLAHGDPVGAARGIFGAKFLQKLNAALMADSIGGSFDALGGGAAGAAGIGAAGLAALYGGFKFGWGIQESSAEGGMRDAGKVLDDYRLSNRLGAGFDLRGLTYTNDRLMIDQSKLGYLGNLNLPMVRRMLAGMGLGAGEWRGGGGDMITAADSIYRRSMDFGVDDGALSGFVGASIRGGETGRSGSAVERLLSRIGGLIAEGNKSGVDSNEKLGVLVGIRQSEQARMGFVSASSTRYMENVSRIFDSSGVAALKGQGGGSTIEKLAGNTNQVFNTTLALEFLNPDGSLNKRGWEALLEATGGDEAMAREALSSFGPQWIAQQLASQGGNRLSWARSLMGRLGGTNGYVISSLLTNGGMNLKDALGVLALRRGDPNGLGSPLGAGSKTSDAARQEAVQYENIAALSVMTQEVKETTRALEDMKKFIDANLVIQQTGKQVQQGAWSVVDHPLQGSRGTRLGVPNSFSMK